MKIRKGITRFSLILFGVFLITNLLFHAFQKQIVFQPDKLHASHNFNFDEPFEEFYIPVKNEKVNALLFETKKVKNGAILYLHGNADNLARWGKYAADFTSRGYDVLMIDYRGYGKSDGNTTEKNIYEDAAAAFQWLANKISQDQIVIYGRSLGSGPATYLAANNRAKMLILETPFDNIKCVEKAKFPFLIQPFQPKYNFPNDQYIQQVECPVFIFHGTKDYIVPLDCAKELEKHLKPTDQFFIVEGGGHKNLNEFEQYHQKLDDILIKK